jgi:RNA polymerase sigma-70 factor (ECF subfamily)
MDDDELIANLAGGDDTALRPLFDRHAPWLAARLRSTLPPQDVEDVLQETFLAVWKNAGTYQPRGTAAAWLWVIARNQAALLLRKRGPVTQALPADFLSAGGAATGTLANRGGQGSGSGGPVSDLAETVATRTDLHAAATAALGPPGGPDREVWRLMYEEDRPVAEVAQVLGVAEGTVKSRAHRARRLLRAALGGTR